VIDGKMAREAELCRNRRNLPLAVRLHDATRDDRIGAARNCLVQDVVELAQLIAAKPSPVASSRLTHNRGRRDEAVSRFSGSSGVGRLAKPNRGKTASRSNNGLRSICIDK